MSNTEENDPNAANENNENENKNETTNAQDNLEQLDLQIDDNQGDAGINLDDVKVDDIPSIDELRNRDDIKISELLDYVDRYQQKIEIFQVKFVKVRENKRENVKKHRGSVIDLHNRMFKKLIETETEQKSELELAQDRIIELDTENKKLKLNPNAIDGDTEVMQFQDYIDKNAALQKELSELKRKHRMLSSEQNVELMKADGTTDQTGNTGGDSHRKSISTLHTNMFKKLLDAEDDFEDKIDKLSDELAAKTRLLQMEKMKNEQSDKLRRDSIQTVHNNMLTKLLDAQAEHDETEERYQNEIKELKGELRKEILKSGALSDKHKEKYGTGEDDDSDVSDLETTEAQEESEMKEAKPKPKPKRKKKQQFDDLWDEADEPEAEMDRLKAHIVKIERELKEEKEKNVFIEKQRKDSIHNLHNNMFQKLLDAEFEYEEEIERLHKEKEELLEKVAFYEDAFSKMNKDNRGSDAVINPTEVIHLKDEIKNKEAIIEENKQKIFQLTQKIEGLDLRVENEQKQRRGSISFLSKQMMAKLLEAEEENEDQRADFKDKLTRLQKELEESKENAFNLEKTRRNSVTKVSQTMFHKLLVAEQTKKQLQISYEAQIKELEQKLAVEQLKTETDNSKTELNAMELQNERDQYRTEADQYKSEVHQIREKSETKERQRRESFTQLQNSYWTKLLQAEDDHETQMKALKHEIVNLQNEIGGCKKSIEWLTVSKMNLITECHRQMNDMRQAVRVYNKNEASASWFG